MSFMRGLKFFIVAPIAMLLPGAPASAGCKKSLTMREVPGGSAQPGMLIECDESQPPALLAPDAHLRVCDPAKLALAGASFDVCADAVERARGALRSEKIRAALVRGEDDAAIVERYGASEGELDALEASVELSGPAVEGAQE